MSAPVVAGVDAPPVLEFAEHVFDLVALAVKHAVMGYLDFPVGFRWDACLDLPIGQGVTQPVGVIAFVGQQNFGGRHGSQQRSRTRVVTDLACREEQGSRTPLAVTDRMQL